MVSRGHGRLRSRSPGRPAARHRDDPGDHRADRGAARVGSRVRGPRATSTSASRRSRRTVALSGQRPDQVEERRSPTRSRRTRATSLSGRRTSRTRTRGGSRPGVAVGRGGTSSARRWRRRSSAPEFWIHGGGLDLVFPHHENERAQSQAARARRSRASGCTTACCACTGEKMSKSLGNVETIRDVLDRWGKETTLLFFMTAPLAQADRLLGGDDGRCAARRPNGLRNVFREAVRARRGACRDTLVAGLEDDFNTARRARAVARVARPRAMPRRCAGARALRSRRPRRDSDPDAAGASRRSPTLARSPASERTGPRPTAFATRSRRRAGRYATSPSRRSTGSCRARDPRARLRAQRRP